MSEVSKKNIDALDHLANAFVKDVLTVSDNDILVEVREDFGDPEKLASEMRKIFEETISRDGKAKLDAARKAVANAHATGNRVVRIDLADARRRYQELIANDHDLSKKLTLAARNGEKQSERDIESAIEDLAELGAFDIGDDTD